MKDCVKILTKICTEILKISDMNYNYMVSIKIFYYLYEAVKLGYMVVIQASSMH